MPSRAESRVLFERVLRGIVVVALAAMWWQSLQDQIDSAGHTESARGASLSGSLLEWSASSRVPRSIQVQMETVPPRIESAWLSALGAAGSSLSWSGDITSTIIDAQPIASPAGGTTVTVAARNGGPVVLRDEVGVIDTLIPQRNGASLALGSITDRLTATGGGSVASTFQSDSVVLRRVMVIGNANWESKFVVAALEEAGWKVDALIRAAPTVDVGQGSAKIIDTARYSAVIALDDASVPFVTRISDFARSGGGIVIGPAAASIPAVESLRAGAVGRAARNPAASGGDGHVSLATISLLPIGPLAHDAIALEGRGTAISLAARRIRAGRAVEIGYPHTWLWRLAGDADAVSAHRAWWSGLVSRVSYAPRLSNAHAKTEFHPAPIIDLIDAIGSPSDVASRSTFGETGSGWTIVLFAILALASLVEIISRRSRGSP